MQTILGANGVIARELSRSLSSSTDRIRRVSRNPHRVNARDEIVTADLLDPAATARAIRSVQPRAGSSINHAIRGASAGSRALQLMHDEPAHRWTVDEIASRIGSSRSVLNQRFNALLGQPPIDYLVAWRIQLAAASGRRARCRYGRFRCAGSTSCTLHG